MSHQLKIIEELERRWPGKFTDDELADLAPRLERFHLDDVTKAFEQHKDRCKFRPTWSELLSLLKVLVVGNSAAWPRAAREEPTFPQLLSAEHRDAPAVAVLLYWRGQWERYATDAVERSRGLTGPALRNARRQWNGWAGKVIRGAESGLVAAGGCPHWAKLTAEVVTDIGPTFDRTVADVRANGVRQPVTRQVARTADVQAVFGADPFVDVPPLERPAEKSRQLGALRERPAAVVVPGDQMPRDRAWQMLQLMAGVAEQPQPTHA